MLISLRDKDKKLIVKDMLDIDFDMSVEKEDNKYVVMINPLYRLAEEFQEQDEAESRMLSIADERNRLENELRNY